MEKKLIEKKTPNKGTHEEYTDFNNLMADANYEPYKSRYDQ